MREFDKTLSNYEVKRKSYELVTMNDETVRILKVFLYTKKSEGCSEKTFKRYQDQLNKFLMWVNKPLDKITTNDLRFRLIDMEEHGLAKSTVKGVRDIYSSFFGWIHKEGYIQSNPCANLGQVKVEKIVRPAYSKIDIDTIRNVAMNNTRYPLKNRAMLELLLSTGMRVSELVGLNRNSINFNKSQCIVFGKGAKERICLFDELTAKYLKDYLESRTDDSDALFVNRFGNRISVGGVESLIRSFGKNAGISKAFPHRFRNTFVTDKLKRGMAIQDVAKLVGHSNLDTTLGYATINVDDLRASYALH